MPKKKPKLKPFPFTLTGTITLTKQVVIKAIDATEAEKELQALLTANDYAVVNFGDGAIRMFFEARGWAVDFAVQYGRVAEKGKAT